MSKEPWGGLQFPTVTISAELWSCFLLCKGNRGTQCAFQLRGGRFHWPERYGAIFMTRNVSWKLTAHFHEFQEITLLSCSQCYILDSCPPPHWTYQRLVLTRIGKGGGVRTQHTRLLLRGTERKAMLRTPWFSQEVLRGPGVTHTGETGRHKRGDGKQGQAMTCLLPHCDCGLLTATFIPHTCWGMGKN